MQPSQHPLRGGEYYKLAVVLGALTAMGPLAIDTYLPALPTIARDLQTSPALVQVSLSVYFVGIALGQAVYGPLSDRVGRKPALYLGLTLFIVASLGCALSPRVEALIVFRFLQALGGCAPLVVPRAIVRDLFDVYFADPRTMPEGWREGLDRAEDRIKARAVSDFIAGMTDTYAVKEHRRLFDHTPDLS